MLSERRIKELVGNDARGGNVFAGEQMRNHTTLRIGGPADMYVMPDNLLSLKNLLLAFGEEGVCTMPVGGGSNLLVSDEGIEGAVISMGSLNHVEVIEENADEVRLFAEAGTTLLKLLNLAKAEGYRGMEGLAGIPGCIGGAVRGNAGSFGFEIGNVVESATVIRMDGKIVAAERDDLRFGYRSCAVPDGSIIVSVNVRLGKDDAKKISRNVNEFLQEKRREQPISLLSAGCVFKNPAGTHAGRLIDEAGCKGMRRGDVEVSGLHANFFVNRGSGTAADFLGLMEDVKERVMKSFGVELEPEIRIVGRRNR
ncbi:MAG TPA: UDP-N-acetylmuramate dehydrogenase [Thermodesulfovibrionales bacterium]|nr:UDP-N-acetylmuramate dehydrogenase [Thermodesulfovibrionales bacterium]